MERFGKFILFCIVAFIGTIWGGYALTHIWGWFIVPIFGLPVLSTVQAMGVALVVGHLLRQVGRSKEEESFTEMIVRRIMIATLWPLLFLISGAIMQYFM